MIVGLRLKGLQQLARVHQFSQQRIHRMVERAQTIDITDWKYVLDFTPSSHNRVIRMIDTISTNIPDWRYRLTLVARYEATVRDYRTDYDLLGILLHFDYPSDLIIVVLNSMEDTTIVRKPETLLYA